MPTEVRRPVAHSCRNVGWFTRPYSVNDRRKSSPWESNPDQGALQVRCITILPREQLTNSSLNGTHDHQTLQSIGIQFGHRRIGGNDRRDRRLIEHVSAILAAVVND